MTGTRNHQGTARARTLADSEVRWHARAVCAQVLCDDGWFPASRSVVDPLVLRVCGGCPVWRDCLLFALGRPEIWDGIWAGLTARELADLRGRLLAGEPAAQVIHLARCVVDQRTVPPIYHAGVPHPLPSRRRLRRQCQQLADLLATPDRHEQHAAITDQPAAVTGGGR